MAVQDASLEMSEEDRPVPFVLSYPSHRIPVSQPGHQLLGTLGGVVPPGQDQAIYHPTPRSVRVLMWRLVEVA